MRKIIKIFSITLIVLGIGILIIPETYNKPDSIDNKVSNNLEAITNNTSAYINNVNLIESQKYDKLLFIGDSRFVGMEKFNENDFFKAEVGEGYSFMVESFPLLTDRYQKNNCIVIGLGVNDLFNVEKYINYINDLAGKFNICVITVGPVEEIKYGDFGYTVTNVQIEEFNDLLKNKLNKNIKLLDINQFLACDGYNTIDGLHYDDETYEKIYQHIKKNLQEG